MHLPARMDGGPHQVIAPGTTWSPTWEIDQPAATLWYHPHLEGTTAEHVYRGLAGMFIVDDPATSAAGLPSRYGVGDVHGCSMPRDLGTGGFDDRFAGGDDRLDVLELRAGDRLRPSPPVPGVLTGLPRLDERDAARTREFELPAQLPRP